MPWVREPPQTMRPERSREPTLTDRRIEDVRAYIRNQREHHRAKSFQEEFRAFLKAYEVEYDERYVWD
jgi:putative transposase